MCIEILSLRPRLGTGPSLVPSLALLMNATLKKARIAMEEAWREFVPSVPIWPPYFPYRGCRRIFVVVRAASTFSCLYIYRLLGTVGTVGTSLGQSGFGD